jgi:polycomb protein EED
VPSIEELESRRKTTSDPLIVYYPHFFSDEVHSNYVDSLAFYGDLIISRAASDPKIRKTINEILIWKIDGFDSDDPAPLEPAIPIVGKNTLSSFPHEEGFRGFRRIATLSMPSTERFYQRFGLFHKPDKRPLLAMGNHVSRFYFFDLQKLEEGTDIREYKGKARRGGSRGGRGAYRGTAAAISSSTAAASRSSEDVHMTGTGTRKCFWLVDIPRSSTSIQKFTHTVTLHKRTKLTSSKQPNHSQLPSLQSASSSWAIPFACVNPTTLSPRTRN